MAQSKYQTHVDLNNQNTTYWHIADMVGSGKRVLDIGCDTGYFGEVLIDRGNKVSGVEYVESSAEIARGVLESVLVADLETVDLAEELGSGLYDVVIFADVLEHLRDPVPVLRGTRKLLAPGGSVLISVPNVAHGDLRLGLLDGEWNYTPIGLLDKTHTRFFTRSGLATFLADAGFTMADLRRTKAPLFGTEQARKREDYSDEIISRIESDPESATYQFVIRAVPDDSGVVAEELATRSYDLQLRVEGLQDELQRTQNELDATRAELGAARAEIDAGRTSVSSLQHELAVARTTKPQAPPPTFRAALAHRAPRLAKLYRRIKPS